MNLNREELLKIMMDIQKKVEEAGSVTTDEIMDDLIVRLKEFQRA